jgi:hypothetical protein
MKESPFKKSPQFNDIGEFDTSFDYGIANALSTSGHREAAEYARSCLHLEDNDAF